MNQNQYDFEDESLAPPVDEPLLVALVRRELSKEEARGVYELIYSFESWSNAHARILIAELKSNRTGGDDQAADD